VRLKCERTSYTTVTTLQLLNQFIHTLILSKSYSLYCGVFRFLDDKLGFEVDKDKERFRFSIHSISSVGHKHDVPLLTIDRLEHLVRILDGIKSCQEFLIAFTEWWKQRLAIPIITFIGQYNFKGKFLR